MATTTIRWTVAKYLLDQLRQHNLLGGVLIAPGWPGDNVRPETIWIDELRGDVSIPVLKAGRMYRDDKFEIPLAVRVTSKGDVDLTMTRLLEIVSAIEDVLADAADLNGFDGLISIEVTSESTTAIDSRDGYYGFGEVVVSAHARLT